MANIEKTRPPERIRHFWLLAGIIALLCASSLAREIDRPFYGLHSVDQAHNAWLARSHVVYGLSYTHGYSTFAVGDPPAEVPRRYRDHPVLYALLDAGAMALLGVNTWALRATNLIATVVTLLLLLRILRALSDDFTALLAGLVFSLLPLIAYFGANQWLLPVCYSAFWCYLTLVGALRDGPAPGTIHRIGLIVLLLLAVQINWQGFFYAAALGIHYVCRCWRRRQRPDRNLLAVLSAAPFCGLALNFVVLAAGGGWDFARLFRLAAWRAGSAERAVHEWGPWLARLWEFAVTNFTWSVLILALAYLTLGQVLLRLPGTVRAGLPGSRRFPQFWLLFLPALFQLILLKGVVWEHQWWQRPLAPVLSVAAALGVLMLGDLLGKLDGRLARPAMVIAVAAIFVTTALGTNHYYGLRYYYPERLELFESLQAEIPPDKALLSFESYLFDQKPGVKQSSYRPEVGWHLNRDIGVARTVEEVEAQARTGKFYYYLMPADHSHEQIRAYLPGFAAQLRSRFVSQEIPGDPGQWLFDLRQRKEPPP